MSSNGSAQPTAILSDTLVLALVQCQEQVRQLEDQSKIVEDLRRENERLRQEIQQLRTTPGEDIEARYRAQFQDAFIQVAEKQGEIERLKEKLRKAKIKAQRQGLLGPITSSPVFPSLNTEPVTPSNPLPVTKNSLSIVDGKILNLKREPIDLDVNQPTSRSRKRPRSLSPQRGPLQEVSINIEPVTALASGSEGSKPKRQVAKDRSATIIAAIPDITEDGEDFAAKNKSTETDRKGKSRSESIYNRLGNLLEARGPESPLLSRVRSDNPSNDHNPQPGITPAKSVTTPAGLPTPDTDPRSKRLRSALIDSRTNTTLSSTKSERLRSKPLDQLSLKHFKINPSANSGLDYAYNQVVRGQDRKCLPGCTRPCCAGTFRAIAATMPNFSNTNGEPMSEYELLLDYLGAGSEERIRNLTPKARENLVHDARIKVAANTYGKMHRDAHERGKSPPGFWRTDMPGTQEERRDREMAKVAERDEVARRYNEALKEGGRWLFADE